jgi:hypothetical protein
MAGFFMRGRMTGVRRFRISLRLMFLVTALFAVFFAWRWAVREQERLELRRSVQWLEDRKKDLEKELKNPQADPFDALWNRRDLPVIEDKLKKGRERLGELGN